MDKSQNVAISALYCVLKLETIYITIYINFTDYGRNKRWNSIHFPNT